MELIASENFVSENVMKAVGSCLTNKYSEGYPAAAPSGNRGRYYGGRRYVDELGEYCCHQWQPVFQTDYHVNVQPPQRLLRQPGRLYERAGSPATPFWP